ncbi:hypothetical protein RD792_015185, partial [Penstemon davidsonii]
QQAKKLKIKTMKINIKDTTLVRPAEATPNGSLWISNIDVVMHNYHTPTVYFYRRPPGVANFFDSAVLKAALGRALVAFYPAAGRLNMNEDGRIEINCNSEGVLFVEAESDGSLDDLGEYFTPKPDLILIPIVDYSLDVSTCIVPGVRNEHHLSDGISALHFINTWADISRGLDITFPPVIDRSHLSARHPPQPQFDHIEYYQPAPTMNFPSDASLETIQPVFKLTRDQLNSLKSNCNDNKNNIFYSSFEVLGGHVWRCVCKARGLTEDQETRIRIPIDGRSRFQPPPPRGYYGNVSFSNTRIAVSGEIVSKPLKHVVSIIHDAIVQMNNDYLRSTIDYLELQPDLLALAIGDHTFKCPNLSINSWVRMPIYDADFGWGKPIFLGPGAISREGKVIMLPSPINDGSILLSIALPKEHMKRFEKIVPLSASNRRRQQSPSRPKALYRTIWEGDVGKVGLGGWWELGGMRKKMGVRNEHHLSDGISALHFIKTWADIARGLDITIPLVIDRSHLSARHPPEPQFDHIEYNQPAPTMNVPSDASLETIIQSVFKLTRDQLNSLKSNCKDDKNDISYSSIEVLGGHVWRCVCKARGLKEDQETMIRIPVDGRSRLQPPPPRGYYGNVIFSNTRIAVSGEIVSKPLKHVVSIVHDAIIQMNNDYLRSTIDYLELQPDLLALAIDDYTFKGPNLSINNWVRMPVFDADFGWGKLVYMLPSPINDGSILLLIALPKEHMKLFEKIVYEI